jgi:tetratricopeptide (TPR) repeat protein
LLAGVLSLCAASSLAQQSIGYVKDAEGVFQEGLNRFNDHRYRESAQVFDRIIREYPSSHRITAAYVMKGKALYRLNENLEASRTLKTFLATYPSSSFVPDARLTLGEVYGRVGRATESLDEFRAAWSALTPTSAPKLNRLLLAAMDSLIDGHISTDTLADLARRSSRPTERAYFWLKIGEKNALMDNIPLVAVALDTLDQRYKDAPFQFRTEALRQRLVTKGSVKLGVLLPLMQKSEPSAVKELGNDVYDGIVYAFEQYSRDPAMRVRVALETRDTEREQVLAGQGVRSLADIPDVIGIIGPVFSTTASAAAVPAQALGIPMITPTANANGIAATGNRIFQANPDYETRGRAMARYAITVKGFKNLAVLAPSDTYGKYLAEGFINEAEALGVRVLATEWYSKGSSDLKVQLSRIRRAAMLASAEPLLAFGGRMKRADLMKLVDHGLPYQRLDSLMSAGAVVPATTLLGPNARALLDSLQIRMEFDETKIDSLEYPVDNLNGIYVPISGPNEIGILSSQIVYFHLNTLILGSGEWNNIAELDANKRYCDGVVFESETFVDSASLSYQEFVRGFIGRFHKRPSRNVLYGYDVAKLVLSCVAGGATTRETLTRALGRVQNFRGLRSAVGFGPGRVSGWLTLLQYSGDAVQRLDEIRVE